MRANEQRPQLRRLRHAFGEAPVRLPFLFAPELDRDRLDALSHQLESVL